MKRRARHVTIAAAVLGAGVVAVLVVVNYRTVRDHVEAWRFQLTEKTETIRGVPAAHRPFVETYRGLFELLASCSREPVIVPSLDGEGYRPLREWGLSVDVLYWQALRKPLSNWPGAAVEWSDRALEILRSNGLRIVEQRFPRRAYVVMRGEGARQ